MPDGGGGGGGGKTGLIQMAQRARGWDSSAPSVSRVFPWEGPSLAKPVLFNN
jgi:hypothetical protein